jgi:hypothetical protein
MASKIYNSAAKDEATGAIDYDTDTFKAMLVTSTYTPNSDTHTKRSDVTNEVSGTGYTAGGATVTVTVSAVDTTNDRVDITLGGNTWSTATITARGAVYYKSRGGAASADELVAYIDFGSDITSTAANFVLASSTLRKTNSNP